MNKIYLCAISNILSGSCKEDCSFCTQSSKYKTDIQRYNFKDIKTVVDEAKRARASKAIGFCLVTSGVGLDDKRKKYMLKALSELNSHDIGLNYIGCNGLAKYEDLIELKEAGLGSYNHNLETSENYYKTICTTHEWKSRYETCLDVKKAGLKLCSGGIFGMGESRADRESLISSLKELEPNSVAINFFMPNPALPLTKNTISKAEAKEIVLKIKESLPNSRIMIAGGREQMFDNLLEVFESGANSIVIGDYLTTKGEKKDRDIEAIEALGYKIAKSCDA